jgi:hypothetical protein
MARLVRAIHFLDQALAAKMDGPHEAGHDNSGMKSIVCDL